MKKIFIVIFASLILLSGCSSNKPIANKDGTILSYKIKDAEPGFYIKEDDKIYPLLNKGITSLNGRMVQWSKKYDQIVPTLSSKNSLVLVSDKNVPEVFEFTKMDDFGYTLGTVFRATTNESGDSVIQFGSEVDQTSVVSEKVKEINSSAVITEINSIEFTIDLLTDEGIVRGLDKDGIYTLYYYVGTKYYQTQLKAESRVFRADYTLTSVGYEREKNNHFTVKLPEDMDPGYYILNGTHMFYYE